MVWHDMAPCSSRHASVRTYNLICWNRIGKQSNHFENLLSLSFFFVQLTLSSAVDPLNKAIAAALLDASGQTRVNENYFNSMHHSDSIKNFQASDYPEVNTTSGLVMGATLPESHAFYSIPYGEAPVGDLRFQPPEAVKYKGNLNVSYPNYLSCFEFPLNCTNDSDCDKNYSEDCLVLNVHVPSSVNLMSPPSELLPVMFWLHGGGFFFGAGTKTYYDGRWLANSTNTIVVSINYRLDALGFLVYEENGVKFEGNQGLKDQQLALQWVHDNIEKFGGNNELVTIFGNSAGAQSTMFHLLSDKSDHYFKRALMESNPASFPYLTKDEAKLTTNSLLEALDSKGSGLECLRTASATSLMNAHIQVMFSDFDFFHVIEPYRPVIDGEEFKGQPLDLFQEGKWQNHKEVLIGTNSEEGAYLNVVFENRIVGERLYGLMNQFAVGPHYAPKVMNKYNELAEPGDDFDYTNILAKEVGDMVFDCPSRALARFISNTASDSLPSTFLYLNSHPLESPNCEEISSFCGYSYHGSETFFVFNAGPSTGLIFSENDTIVSDIFSNFWGHFAYFGKPTTDIAIWPQYTKKTLNQGLIPPWTNVRIEAPNSRIEDGYNEEWCDFWDNLGFYVNITSPTETTTTSIAEDTTAAAETFTPTITTTAAATTTTTLDGENEMTTTGTAADLKHSYISVFLCLILTIWCFIHF